jgi:hypothetical protein
MVSSLSRLGLVAAFLLAGCASSDLSKNTDITSEVVECLPTDAPAPSVVARAVWFANASGFGSTNQSPMHAAGVLALAGYKLYFMTWNDAEHHFDMLQVIDVLHAAKIRVDRAGDSAMLVIESRNLSFDSFELTNRGQFAADPQATRALYEKLEALRAKNPQSEP